METPETTTTPLPKAKPMDLTLGNMELIQRLAAMDLSKLLSDINRFNKVTKSSAIFVFVANGRRETGDHPQRVFEIEKILTSPADVAPTVAQLQADMPHHAIRVISMFDSKLSSAVQYDPVIGRPNDEITISD